MGGFVNCKLQLFYDKYKPIDASPSGLLEILIMFLSPFKKNISFSVQETDTISPDPSKPAIVACPKKERKEKTRKSHNQATVIAENTQTCAGVLRSQMTTVLCYGHFLKLLKSNSKQGPWLALSGELRTLGLRVVSPNPTLGVEIKLKKNNSAKVGSI